MLVCIFICLRAKTTKREKHYLLIFCMLGTTQEKMKDAEAKFAS